VKPLLHDCNTCPLLWVREPWWVTPIFVTNMKYKHTYTWMNTESFTLLGTTESNPQAVIKNLSLIYNTPVPHEIQDSLTSDTAKDLDNQIRTEIANGDYRRLKWLGIGVLRPKITRGNHEELVADLEQWVSRKNIPNPEYLPELKEIVRNVVDEMFVNPALPEYDLNTWFEKRPNEWATAGMGGMVRGLEGTKKIYTWIDGRWPLHRILAQPPINRVAFKPEPGKLRLIISGDLGTQILMSYVESNLKLNSLQKIKGSGMAPEVLRQWRASVLNNFNAGRMALSLDQSKFDHNISKKEILIVVDALCDKARISEDVRQMLLARLHSSIIEFRGHRLSWEGGMLSGWKWTNLIESILSIAIVRWMSRRLGRIYDEVASGDDVAFFVDDESWLSKAVELGKTIHKEIHMGKSYPSRFNVEFLRQIYTSDGRILRYPLRALRPLIYRDKTLKPDTRERAEMWRKFIHRCDQHWYNPVVLIDTIARDLHGLNKGKFSKSVILSLLSTPVKAGGLGLWHTEQEQGHKLLKVIEQAELPTRRREMSPLVQRLLSDRLSRGYREYVVSVPISYVDSPRALPDIPRIVPAHDEFEPFEFQARLQYKRLDERDAKVLSSPGWTVKQAMRYLDRPSDCVFEDQYLQWIMQRYALSTDLCIYDRFLYRLANTQLSVGPLLF